MLLKALAPFEGGIKSKAVTSSLSGEGSLLKLGSLSFGSPLSASDVGNPIFDIRPLNTLKTRPIFLHLYCLDQSKMYYPMDIWQQAPRQKSMVVSMLLIPSQVDQEVLSLYHQQGGINLRHLLKSIQRVLVVSDW